MKSAKRLPFLPFPRRPRDTKERNALRKVLASNVWIVKDWDAYARQFEYDMGFRENTMTTTAEQQQAQIPAEHGNNQRSDRQEHAR